MDRQCYHACIITFSSFIYSFFPVYSFWDYNLSNWRVYKTIRKILTYGSHHIHCMSTLICIYAIMKINCDSFNISMQPPYHKLHGNNRVIPIKWLLQTQFARILHLLFICPTISITALKYIVKHLKQICTSWKLFYRNNFKTR